MNELDKLRELLRRSGIPFEDYQETSSFSDKEQKKIACLRYGAAHKWQRNQIIYGRKAKGWRFDGLCQYGSQGAKLGLIEAYGDLGEDKDHMPRVINAWEAFKIIYTDWERQKQRA